MNIWLIVLLGAGSVVMLVLWVQSVLTQKEEAMRKRIETLASENVARTRAAAVKQQAPALGITSLLSSLLGPKFAASQAELLASADLPLRAGEFIALRLACAAVAGLVGLVLMERAVSALPMVGIAYMLPVMYARWRREYRRSQFELQLPDTLQLITNSLRSGFSFVKAIEVAAQSSAPPMNQNLGVVLRENALGMPIEDALRNMARRVQSQDFDITVSAYLIQHEVGGNLAVVMEKVADTVRQRLRLRGELRVLTAQGKFSGWIVGLLPLAVFVALLIYSPGYFDPLLKSELGQMMLGAAVVWQMIGVAMIRKVVNIKM